MNTKDRLFYIELFDIYSSLLTKHQVDILNDYLYNDFSMAEISINRKVSKSAISDLINRSLKQLKEYDCKLKLINKYNKIRKEVCKDRASKNVFEKIIRG